MKHLKTTLFTLRIVMGVLLPVGVSAQEIQTELPQNENYNFQSDPYLLTWTFDEVVNEEVKPAEPAPPSPEDKVLNRWKEKQAHLWKALPVGKKFTVNASAYTAAADECGKSDGITASGLKVTEQRTLACPPSYPFGTMIAIEGMGTYRCEDRGGAIKGNKFDIYMETKKEAFAFGRQNLLAEIVQ